MFPLTSTDVLGNTETKTYSYLTGLINLIVDEEGIETAYIYDKDDNLLNVTSGKNNNYKSITYTYDVNGLLTSIIQDNITYSFTYNDYNDVKTIKINNDTILTNNYNNEDGTGVYVGELNETVYSYGTVSFDYDDEHQITAIYYNNTKVLEYTYNDYGEISSYIDYKENVTYYYNYDYQNRLINVKTTTGNNITYTYNDDSLLTSVDNKNGLNTYEYDEKDYLIEENISDNKYKISYSYSTDTFKQLNVISYYLSNNQIAANYTYEKNIVNGKDIYTGRIKEIEYTGINNKTIRYEYTYDSNSNITKILGYTNNTLTYEENNTYDIFNQLVEQAISNENGHIGKVYNYDSLGNILNYDEYNFETQTTIKSYSFTYNAKNELTKAVIDGKTYNITYSSTGQPNKYFDWDITYDMRSIKTLSKDDNNTIEYSYNANGVRISKEVTINGITTNVEYVLNGTNIIEETRTTGSAIETLQYHYDSNNSIIGFTYCEGNPVNCIDSNGQFALTAILHFVFIVMMVVLIPTAIAAVSSYIPKKDEDEMDRQDITNDKKPLPTLPTTSTPKTDPPKGKRESGIYDSSYEDLFNEGAVDSTMGQYRGGIERVQDNYNFNVEMFNKGDGLGGELEYIFNRDKYELWD